MYASRSHALQIKDLLGMGCCASLRMARKVKHRCAYNSCLYPILFAILALTCKPKGSESVLYPYLLTLRVTNRRFVCMVCKICIPSCIAFTCLTNLRFVRQVSMPYLPLLANRREAYLWCAYNSKNCNLAILALQIEDAYASLRHGKRMPSQRVTNRRGCFA